MTETARSSRALVTVGIVTAAVVVGHYLGLLKPVERLVLSGLRPLGLWIIGAAPQAADSSSSEELRQRVVQLESEVAQLSVENVTLKQSLDAALSATNQQQFIAERNLTGITGRVFARSPDPTSEFVTVNVGERSGVRVGAPAIISDGIVVGRVISVTPETAQILLSLDNRSSFEGVVVDLPGAKGVVSGTGGLAMRMTLIPQSENVQPSQLVVTAGTDRNIPNGLLLGQVNRVERQEGALFQTASLRALYTSTSLDSLTIILPPQP